MKNNAIAHDHNFLPGDWHDAAKSLTLKVDMFASQGLAIASGLAGGLTLLVPFASFGQDKPSTLGEKIAGVAVFTASSAALAYSYAHTNSISLTIAQAAVCSTLTIAGAMESERCRRADLERQNRRNIDLHLI